MKQLKFLILAAFMTAAFFSCKKTDINPAATGIEKTTDATVPFSVNNGIVSFSSFADYLKVVESPKVQHITDSILKVVEFTSLASKTPVAAAGKTTGITSFTNAFDKTLYTDFMLSILNADKICSINGYWIKVDMDNGFCSALDANKYASQYTDLVNNTFSNKNIMVFLNQDEPVLRVLSAIQKGALTWDGYVVLRSAKGGQGICFRRGAPEKYNETTKPLADGLKIISIARYLKNFLHFELYAEGIANGQGISDNVIIQGDYSWEGVCQGSSSSKYQYYGGFKSRYTMYSGGSALYAFNLTTTTYAKAHMAYGYPAHIQAP